MEHIRIIGIPMSLKKNFKVLLREFLEELEYRETDKEEALTWPSMIGSHGSTFGVRVKMSFKFWNWYKTQGGSNLGKYSRRNGCAIRLIQEKGLIGKDCENL
ncbi:unnamed protein product [Nippostrongylus brasiliensis]|uniref:MIT_C domain-containing protein n=1 Tax=Nippostrongylus brasiliensis TaxID=27835 RepID=A0A0N4Y7H0_NIPBR|nr:unnamed protein product [Nippostrongylus brasiliensis]